MSNREPSAIVLHGIACIGGLYISLESNGERVRGLREPSSGSVWRNKNR
jgi:hypothetical protein